ncbi:SnoaL-like domain-containing protein [Nonomuraea sp. NN258]|nr:SnoaL-like domain-containing protein [Nonomuraea antri]
MLAVAALSAAWFGWSWHSAANDPAIRYAQVRDEALRSGSQAVQNMNTLSHRTVEQDLRLWEDSTTAQLHQQIVQGRAAFVEQVAKARTATTAKILEAALTDLDADAGRARILAAVQITVIPEQGEPVIKKSRLVGELIKTAAGWKLGALSQAVAGPTGR